MNSNFYATILFENFLLKKIIRLMKQAPRVRKIHTMINKVMIEVVMKKYLEDTCFLFL